MKNKYKDLAEKTLRIIQTGTYEVDEKIIDVRAELGDCLFETKTFSPSELYKLKDQITPSGNAEAEISVINATSIEAILLETNELKTAVLNFASARNPGGGFMGGAIAQEESLARSSSLYASQTKNTALYEFNKKNTSFLYSDYMIYSPGVVFWMNDNGDMLNPPVLVDVITSPAPNRGAMLQHARRSELAELETVFKNRMEKVMALAVSNGVERLILGAWGCGVFQNDYKDVATYFSEVIDKKYKYCFKEIVFAIYDRSKTKNSLQIFQEVFNK